MKNLTENKKYEYDVSRDNRFIRFLYCYQTQTKANLRLMRSEYELISLLMMRVWFYENSSRFVWLDGDLKFFSKHLTIRNNSTIDIVILHYLFTFTTLSFPMGQYGINLIPYFFSCFSISLIEFLREEWANSFQWRRCRKIFNNDDEEYFVIYSIRKLIKRK